MSILFSMVMPSGVNAQSYFHSFQHSKILRNFDIWQRHDVVKHCGTGLLTAGAPARFADARG
jgi:hypothetical protein